MDVSYNGCEESKNDNNSLNANGGILSIEYYIYIYILFSIAITQYASSGIVSFGLLYNLSHKYLGKNGINGL